MVSQIIRREPIDDTHLSQVSDPLIRQIDAQRGMAEEEYPLALKQLLLPNQLHGIERAAQMIAEAMVDRQRILIVGDFDADGATSTAIMLLALRDMGAMHVDYLIPNRFNFGYGLSPELVEVAQDKKAELLVTVDNGISSFAGVAAAKALGMRVVVTDHHLPAEHLPDADAIVNPNQPDCTFPSKAIAGCGVAFYVMCAVKNYLTQQGWFVSRPLPNLGDYLDLVALGTVADVVPLDKNNRILVQAGLHRIRQGRCRAGITALLDIAKRQPLQLVAADLGFALGPRLNAAGRLDDMSLGVELLLCDDALHASRMAHHLDRLNKERRHIEQTMQESAQQTLEQLTLDVSKLPLGLVLYEANWHQGVMGIVASRLKEKYHRPVIAFAQSSDDEIKGSARSISGLHIRDLLDEVNRCHPQLILSFGGHAMAAGLTVKQKSLELFTQAFQQVLARHMSDDLLQGKIWSDGSLPVSRLTLDTAQSLMDAGPWGQAFEEPLFDDEFFVLRHTCVAEKHIRLELMTLCRTKRIGAMLFHADLDMWSDQNITRVHLAYRLHINIFRQQRQLQLIALQAIPHLDKF